MMLEAAARIWPVALAAIPLAVLVTVLCRILPLRPSTRHTLFLTVVLFLLLAPFLPAAPNVAHDIARDLPGWRAARSSGFRDLAPAIPPVSLPPGEASVITRETAASPPLVTADPGSPDRPAAPRSLVRHDDPIAPTRRQWSPAPLASIGAISAARRAAGAGTPSAATPTTSGAVANAATGSASGSDGPSRAAGDRTLNRTPDRTPDRTPLVARTPTIDIRGSSASAADVPSDVAAGATEAEPSVDRSMAVAPSFALVANQLRGAIAAIPPVPATVWFGGSLLVVLMTLARFARLGRILRQAEPASADIRATVLAAAREIGLRDAPRTLMVDARLSPLVTVVPRRHLVLPRALWSQLDGPGRRAVILHELAHLSRRDHWVVWLDLLVGVVYWWHPVAWWVRRRLCEEADLSCDAWVTTLLPGARRAYATALLESRVFASAPAPAAALGASNIRKKRFARRLTMVMSHTVTPRRTLAGLTLASSLGALGWLVAPTFACPPEGGSGKAQVRTILTSTPCPPDCDAPCCADEDEEVSTFEKFMQDERIDGARLQEQLGELEGQIEAFAARLADWAADLSDEKLHALDLDADQLAAQLSEMRFDNEQLESLSQGVAYLLNNDQAQRAIGTVLAFCDDDPPKAHAAPKAVKAPKPPRAVKLPKAPKPPSVTYQSIGQATGQHAGQPAPRADPRITRSYQLPDGKLDALTELMALDDVPILISPGDDAITVHATMEQHMVFGAFVTMINAQEERVGYALSSEKLEALTQLMVRGDVPVLVTPGDDAITVIGDSLEQLIFGAFVEMIAPRPGPDFRMSPPAAASSAARAYEVELGSGAKAYERRARADVARIAELKSMHESLEHEAKKYAAECDRIEAETNALETKLESIEEHAEEIEERAEEAEADERIEYVHKYNDLMLEAQQVRNLARLREVEAGSLEARMEEIEERIEAIAEQIEALVEAIEEGVDHDDDDDHDHD